MPLNLRSNKKKDFTQKDATARNQDVLRSIASVIRVELPAPIFVSVMGVRIVRIERKIMMMNLCIRLSMKMWKWKAHSPDLMRRLRGRHTKHLFQNQRQITMIKNKILIKGKRVMNRGRKKPSQVLKSKTHLLKRMKHLRSHLRRVMAARLQLEVKDYNS